MELDPVTRQQLLFQFLIGRLGTTKITDTINAGPVFQFLIGRLGTEQDAVNRLIELKFQFLIGRLGTGANLMPY